MKLQIVLLRHSIIQAGENELFDVFKSDHGTVVTEIKILKKSQAVYDEPRFRLAMTLH